MFTRIAPAFAAAYCVIIHSARLPLQMPTRSPRCTPSAISARAAIGFVAELAVRVAELLMARDECVAVAPAFGRTVQGAADRVREQRRGPDAVHVGEVHVVSSPNSIGPQKTT